MKTEITTLDEKCLFINGGAWKQTEYADYGIPVVQVKDMQGGTVIWTQPKFLPESSYQRYSQHQLETNDLVIATVGSHPDQPNSVVGRATIIPQYAEGALLNQNAVCIRPKDSTLDKRYLIEARNLKQTDLVGVIGSSSVVSEILNGKQQISKAQAKALGEFFQVDAELFD